MLALAGLGVLVLGGLLRGGREVPLHLEPHESSSRFSFRHSRYSWILATNTSKLSEEEEEEVKTDYPHISISIPPTYIQNLSELIHHVAWKFTSSILINRRISNARIPDTTMIIASSV